VNVEVRYGEQIFTANVQGRSIRVGDATFQVEPMGDGLYRVSDGTRHWLVAAAGPPANRWIWVHGHAAQVEIQRDVRSRQRTRSSSEQLAAPMPATVLRLLVESGTRVTKGETVLILEAMKMELPIRAPRDGLIRAIHCQPGELVQPGVNLLDLE
jgi:3-methylcrotonyl-CoA carboxylase alpha subunit